MTEKLKSICILHDASPFWEEVKKYLLPVNAHFSVMAVNSDPSVVAKLNPNLIIMSATKYFSLAPMTRSSQKLVIDEDGRPGQHVPERERRNVVIVGWPMVESDFVKLTSRMLSVSQRRFFKALIRIFPRGKQESYMGESDNFSLSGLAFKTHRTFREGDEVAIAFSIPAMNKTTNLEAQVVRSMDDHTDGGTVYGARFINMSSADRSILERFIQTI